MTKKDLATFLGFAKQYTERFSKERSRLTFALNKFSDKYKKFKEKYQRDLQEKRAELEAKHCLKEKDTQVFVEKEVVVQGQVIFRKSFTKEAEAELKKEFDAFEEDYGSKEIEFTPFIVPVPEKIDITWVKEFTGFVFEPMTEEQEEAWYLAQQEDKKE